MSIVYLETNHDSTTMQVHQARRKVMPNPPGTHSAQVHSLFGAHATAQAFIIFCGSGQRWGLFSGMGHGDSHEFEGYHANVVTDDANRSGTLRFFAEKIVHLYSCNTAKNLGKVIVSNRARAFIGYSNFVGLASNPTIEEQFVSISAEIDKAILAGDNHAATKAKADAQYRKVRGILTASSSSATPTDIRTLDKNHAALTGPWTSRQYGRF